MKLLTDKLIDIHIAEYEALNTRCTYFMNLQIIVSTAIVTSAVIMITVFYPLKIDVLLGYWPICSMQLFTNISANMFYEQYRIVRYIETELKPNLAKLTNSSKEDNIWGIENTIQKQRNAHFLSSATFWESGGVVVIGILLSIVFYYNIRRGVLSQFNLFDILGIFLNGLLFVVYSYRMIGAIKLRKVYKVN